MDVVFFFSSLSSDCNPVAAGKKRKKGTTVTTFSDFGFEAMQKVVNTVDDQENAGK